MEFRIAQTPVTPVKQSPTRIAPKTPKTPIDRGRRPPRLVLPTPSAGIHSPYVGSVTSRVSNPYMYPSGDSNFVTGLKGLAKSGLSIGEQSTFWCYSKLSLLSRKWFTHCFLSIVLVLYTVGGALVFIAVEGRGEDLALMDTRQSRYDLIRELRNLSIFLPDRKSDGEWEGAASNRIEQFEDQLIEAYKTKALIIGNRGGKVWTFFNSVVYCGTIYTTIDVPTIRRKSQNEEYGLSDGIDNPLNVFRKSPTIDYCLKAKRYVNAPSTLRMLNWDSD